MQQEQQSLYIDWQGKENEDSVDACSGILVTTAWVWCGSEI